MPLFHFHLRILTTRIDDQTGTEFPDLDAATAEARRRARRMIDERRLAGAEYSYEGIFDISNAAGDVLKRIAVAEGLPKATQGDRHRTVSMGAMKGGAGTYCNYRTDVAWLPLRRGR